MMKFCIQHMQLQWSRFSANSGMVLTHFLRATPFFVLVRKLVRSGHTYNYHQTANAKEIHAHHPDHYKWLSELLQMTVIKTMFIVMTIRTITINELLLFFFFLLFSKTTLRSIWNGSSNVHLTKVNFHNFYKTLYNCRSDKITAVGCNSFLQNVFKKKGKKLFKVNVVNVHLLFS